ncbi:hypothetical protein QBC39DRAFT_329023 [Podospora conica]|nr:hypothetical protein QBC39DRAFT_329023 [Schizothecium conicum]
MPKGSSDRAVNYLSAYGLRRPPKGWSLLWNPGSRRDIIHKISRQPDIFKIKSPVFDPRYMPRRQTATIPWLVENPAIEQWTEYPLFVSIFSKFVSNHETTTSAVAEMMPRVIEAFTASEFTDPYNTIINFLSGSSLAGVDIGNSEPPDMDNATDDQTWPSTELWRHYSWPFQHFLSTPRKQRRNQLRYTTSKQRFRWQLSE